MQVKVTLTLKEEELKKIMDDTGLTTAEGLKGYCLGSNILRNIRYEFSSKWNIGFEVIEDEQCPIIPEVKEVKRPAKVGEYVKLTYDGLFKGRIYKVREINSKAYWLKDVAYVDIVDDVSFGYTEDEYVVLENYEPEDGEKK